MCKILENLDMFDLSCIKKHHNVYMRTFLCPICSCIYVDEPYPKCTVFGCTNTDKKYNEDI